MIGTSVVWVCESNSRSKPWLGIVAGITPSGSAFGNIARREGSTPKTSPKVTEPTSMVAPIQTMSVSAPGGSR